MENATKSFAPEVQADASGKWYGNALRFATEAEALANVRDLYSRWTLVTATRVVPSCDPVNYAWRDGELIEVLRPVTCDHCGQECSGRRDTCHHCGAILPAS